MKSFIANLLQLFKLDTEREAVSNFDLNKKKLIIPKYQREYKWKNEKIISLFSDIKKNSKFLGNIILDQTENGYEIIDGQQRITTCMLIFIAMYNRYHNHPREQAIWEQIIKPQGNFVFINESVGDFIAQTGSNMQVFIAPDADIYQQASDFVRAFNTITECVNGLSDNNEIIAFRQKMFDCNFLVLINDNHDYARPVEQLFLDINEKAQKLEVEDVFKGHCFENYDADYHDELKEKWVELKHIAMQYTELGFENTSEYIYLYLLEMVDRDLPNDLTLLGRHFLEGKTMDDTADLLDKMIAYGKTGLSYSNDIGRDDYRFINLCEDSRSRENTTDHIALKIMSREMLFGTGSTIYQKLPLLSFLYYLANNNQLVHTITHDQYRKIITNLYIYMKLFVISGHKKSKKIIDLTLREAMESDNQISGAIEAVKALRKEKVESFEMLQTYTGDKLKFISSIIDYYKSHESWLPIVYGSESKYNDEHFIIMKSKKVDWIDGEINLIVKNFPNELIKINTKKATNHLVLDHDLNEVLGSRDIITKINLIREWYANRNSQVPNHVKIYIEYIEQLPQYIELKRLKGTTPTLETVKTKYIDFLNAYFREENVELIKRIKNAFVAAFS